MVVVVVMEEERVGSLPWRKPVEPSLVNGNGIGGELRRQLFNYIIYIVIILTIYL